MKTLFISMAILFCAVATASGQILKIGLRGGMNINNYSFAPVTVGTSTVSSTKGSNDSGFQFGMVMRVSIPRFIHLQPEFSIFSRNYNLTVTDSNHRMSLVKLNAKVVEIPVTFGYNVGVIRVFGGPVFRFTDSQSTQPKGSGLSIKTDDGNVAMLLGLGIDAGNFFIDARYITMNKSSETSFTLDGITQSTRVNNDEVWQFSVGFFF